MIKAKDYTTSFGAATNAENGRVHVSEGKGWICGVTRVRGGTDLPPVSADRLCPKCEKIARKRGLLEEVPEHIAAMPKCYRIMEVGEVITADCKWWEGSWNGARASIGARIVAGDIPFCCPVDDQKPAEVIDKPVQDPIKVKLHEYECRAKAAEDEVAELKLDLEQSRFEAKSLADEVRKLEKKNLDLIEDRDELAAANDELNEDDAKQTKLLCDYEQATNGHTLEAIKTIMQAMPSAEDLEGYELRWGMPKKGESFVEALKGQTLWGVATADFDNPMARWLIRTPIVEYIPTEEITDELCEELGRIECEVRTTYEEEWLPSKLLAVWSGNQFPYSVKGGVVHYRHCRIKRSTIERLRGAK